jgi:hypothetical protein
MREVRDPDPHIIGSTVQEFLRWLEGPTAIWITGADTSRTRAYSTLLHGNEPSGVIALHRWLRAEETPAVNIVFFIGAVSAALTAPAFSHRMLPGRRDLNRCFEGPDHDDEGRLAAQLLRLLRSTNCEALVDVHNNTGHNPPYGIATGLQAESLSLVSLFANRCVHSDLNLGTLTEATSAIPSVAIEAGRSHTPEADAVALAGLERYVHRAHLFHELDTSDMRIYECPIQVRLTDGTHVVFASEPVDDADLTLLPAVDEYNFDGDDAGTLLGWVRDSAPWPLAARNADGDEVSGDHFEIRDGMLLARQPILPIMMTTDERIARDDCLCYLVRDARVSSSNDSA